MLTKFVVTDRIGMDLVIKVADFGLSVSSGNKDYYRVTSDMGVRLPLKWMAPESLTDYIFSEMSDVVSALVKHSYNDHAGCHEYFNTCSGPMELLAGRCLVGVKSHTLP